MSANRRQLHFPLHSLGLPAIRLGPCGETLAQAIAAIGMLGGDIALLQRVGLQIVESDC